MEGSTAEGVVSLSISVASSPQSSENMDVVYNDGFPDPSLPAVPPPAPVALMTIDSNAPVDQKTGLPLSGALFPN